MKKIVVLSLLICLFATASASACPSCSGSKIVLFTNIAAASRFTIRIANRDFGFIVYYSSVKLCYGFGTTSIPLNPGAAFLILFMTEFVLTTTWLKHHQNHK